MTDKCPSCEYNKLRAEMWREEAYRQAGTPLPEPRREWVGLTDEDVKDIVFVERSWADAVRKVEAKLREKNT